MEARRTSFLDNLPDTQTFSPQWTSTGKPASDPGLEVDADLLEAASMDIDEGDFGCHEDEIALLEQAECSAAAQAVNVATSSAALRPGDSDGSPHGGQQMLEEKLKALEQELEELKKMQLSKDGEIRLLRDRQREQERQRAEQAAASRLAEDLQRQQKSEAERQLKEEVDKLSAQLSFQSHENLELQRRLHDVRKASKEINGKSSAKGPSSVVKTDAFPTAASFVSGFSSQKRPHTSPAEADEARSSTGDGTSAKRTNRGVGEAKETEKDESAMKQHWVFLNRVPSPDCNHGPLLLKKLLSGDIHVSHMHGLAMEGSLPSLNMFSLLSYSSLPVVDAPSSIKRTPSLTPQRIGELKTRSKDLHHVHKLSASVSPVCKPPKAQEDSSQLSHLSATLRNLLTLDWRTSTPLTPQQQQNFNRPSSKESSATELFCQLAAIACEHCSAFLDSLQTSCAEASMSSSSVDNLGLNVSLHSAQVEVRNLGLTALLVTKRLLECSPLICRQLATCTSLPHLHFSAVSPNLLGTSSSSSESLPSSQKEVSAQGRFQLVSWMK